MGVMIHNPELLQVLEYAVTLVLRSLWGIAWAEDRRDPKSWLPITNPCGNIKAWLNLERFPNLGNLWRVTPASELTVRSTKTSVKMLFPSICFCPVLYSSWLYAGSDLKAPTNHPLQYYSPTLICFPGNSTTLHLVLFLALYGVLVLSFGVDVNLFLWFIWLLNIRSLC